MKVYLDFNGTCVEDVSASSIGRCNFGCIEVIKKLQDAGHEVILNTSFVDYDPIMLKKALDWFGNAYMFVSREVRDDFELKPISNTKTKMSAMYWDWEFFMDNDFIIIDDLTSGIPLKRCAMSSGFMVDWDVLDVIFKEKGIY
jgi:hypothetical protein